MLRTVKTPALKILLRAGIGVWAAMLPSGCETALVPLAAYTAEGLSYASSGKGLADHAISAATRRDCALYRLAQGGGLCALEDSLKQAPALAMAERTAGGRAADERIRDLIARTEGWRPAERDGASREQAGAAQNPVPRDASSVPFN